MEKDSQERRKKMGDTKKATKITIEYEDKTETVIEGPFAVLFQARVNSSGILSGIETVEIEDAERIHEV